MLTSQTPGGARRATTLSRITPVEISVVICAYTERRWEDMRAAIRSARTQTLAAHEVILVVDHSPDLLARARAARWTQLHGVRIVCNAREKGLSGARNTGLAAARGNVVAFLDDDAAAEEGWLESLAEAYKDPQVLGVGGSVQPAWQVARPSWMPPEFDWVIGCSYIGLPTTTTPVRNFIGANMSFRRDVLAELGGFSAALGRNGDNAYGCEETELCIRAASCDGGGLLLYEPSARVRHKVPASRGTWKYFLTRCYSEGRSKAVVSRLAGSQQALSSERSYLRYTIPHGVLRGIASTLRGRPSAMLTVLALVAGVAATVVGYFVGQHPLRSAAELARSKPLRTAAAATTPVAVALGLWAFALESRIPLGSMNDYGLLSVLPLTYWIALAVLTVSFCWSASHYRAHTFVLAAHVVALIAILHATPALLYHTLRYAWAWKDVTIAGYTLHHGAIDHHLDILSAWSAWPGFFALNAMLAKASGLASTVGYASWAPAVNELACLGPLLLIFRRFTADRRLTWAAVWLFYLGQWVGQDYFSPQAFAYFLYLVVIAVCLRWFRPEERTLLSETDVWLGDLIGRQLRRQRLLLYGLVCAVLATIAVSHQLTPFMAIAALGFLTLTRRLRYRTLPLVMMAFTAAWVLFSAQTWLHANLYWVIQSLGHPFSNTASRLVATSRSRPQAIIEDVDRLLSASLWVLAAIGYWRHRRQKGHRDWTPLLILALAPISAVFGNSYGGEIDFRVYMFALPFVAVYAGAAFFPSARAGRSWITAAVASTVAGVLLCGFLFAYYGKERMNYFPPREVATMENLYATAPSGSLLIGATDNLPFPAYNYREYAYEMYASDQPGLAKKIEQHPVETLAGIMSTYRHAYLITSVSQSADVEMNGSLPRGALSRIDRAVRESGRFQVWASNPDVTIFTLAPPQQYMALADESVADLKAAVYAQTADVIYHPAPAVNHQASRQPKVTAVTKRASTPRSTSTAKHRSAPPPNASPTRAPSNRPGSKP